MCVYVRIRTFEIKHSNIKLIALGNFFFECRQIETHNEAEVTHFYDHLSIQLFNECSREVIVSNMGFCGILLLLMFGGTSTLIEQYILDTPAALRQLIFIITVYHY